MKLHQVISSWQSLSGPEIRAQEPDMAPVRDGGISGKIPLGRDAERICDESVAFLRCPLVLVEEGCVSGGKCQVSNYEEVQPFIGRRCVACLSGQGRSRKQEIVPFSLKGQRESFGLVQCLLRVHVPIDAAGTQSISLRSEDCGFSNHDTVGSTGRERYVTGWTLYAIGHHQGGQHIAQNGVLRASLPIATPRCN